MGLISLWGSWSSQAGWRRRPATWRIRGTVDRQIVEKEEPSTHPGIVTRPRPHLSDDQTFREAPIVLSSNGILLRAPQAEWLMGSQGRVNHCYRLFVFLIDFNIHIRTRKRLEVVFQILSPFPAVHQCSYNSSPSSTIPHFFQQPITNFG